MAIKQIEKLEVEDEFNVTRKVSALGFTKLELSTKQRPHVKNFPVKVRRVLQYNYRPNIMFTVTRI